MRSQSAPVLVMRWFRNGSGYAYDSRIDHQTLTQIIETLNGVFRQRQDHSFRLALPGGGLLLGDKFQDPTCLDPQAADREPSVVRLVLLDQAPRPRLESRLRAELARLPLPTESGPRPSGLELNYPTPLEVPVAHRIVSHDVTRVGMLVVLMALLALEVYWQVNESAASPAAWACRVFAACVAIRLTVWPGSVWIAQQKLTELERGWFEAAVERDGRALQGMVGDATSVVLPDGRRLLGATMGNAPPSTWLGLLPTPVGDPTYDRVSSYQGYAQLEGVERLYLPDGSERDAFFVRGYAAVSDRWELIHLQWTPTDAAGRGQGKSTAALPASEREKSSQRPSCDRP